MARTCIAISPQAALYENHTVFEDIEDNDRLVGMQHAWKIGLLETDFFIRNAAEFNNINDGEEYTETRTCVIVTEHTHYLFQYTYYEADDFRWIRMQTPDDYTTDSFLSNHMQY